MSKLVSAALLSLLLSVSVMFADTNTKDDPTTMPVYTGSINDPNVKVVYEDTTGKYVVVIVDGVLKIYYL
ncbi:MAG: hypothetical protein U1B83_06015 [Candidatus Cloacimonadaceae bacterium]|nr:hypothetical protein [Candidatus Cloacimonadaceae bacterium]